MTTEDVASIISNAVVIAVGVHVLIAAYVLVRRAAMHV